MSEANKWYVQNHFEIPADRRAEMEAALPKRRHKTVRCPITGQNTYNRDGISSDAWALMRDGLRYQDAKASGELKTYITVPRNWYAALDGPTGFNPRPPSGRWLESPADCLREMFPDRVRDMRSSRLGSLLERGYILLETEHNAVAEPHTDGIYGFELTEAEAAIARTLVNAMMNTARAVIMPAYRAGQSLLMNIAGGGLSFDDINKITAKMDK